MIKTNIMAVFNELKRKVHHKHEINHDHPMTFHQHVLGLHIVNEQQTN